jgi:hypothetical protein
MSQSDFCVTCGWLKMSTLFEFQHDSFCWLFVDMMDSRCSEFLFSARFACLPFSLFISDFWFIVFASDYLVWYQADQPHQDLQIQGRSQEIWSPPFGTVAIAQLKKFRGCPCSEYICEISCSCFQSLSVRIGSTYGKNIVLY